MRELKNLPAVIAEPELLPKDETFCVAGRSWSSMNIRRMVCLQGKTIRGILFDVLCKDMGKEPTELQLSAWLDRCRVKVDGIEINVEEWGTFKPQAGSFVEFLIAPGKGGGGKNILSSVLMIAVVAASVWTFGVVSTWAGATWGATATAMTGSTTFAAMNAAGMIAGAVAAGAVYTMGTWAVSKICPTVASPQAQISSSAAASSQTYSISGARNQAAPFGYVPLVLGKYRFAGPLGAKSWTEMEGDDQYFNMLVVWGHADMSVKDFRIGETPLENFKDVTHVFHGSTTGNDLRYFGRSYDEQTVGTTLTYKKPVTRVVGECDSISIDIYSPAMADVSSGNVSGASADFKIEYALVGSNEWKTFSASTRFFTPSQYRDCYTGASQNDAWATADGSWHVRLQDSDWGDANWTVGKIRASDPHWTPYPIERYKDKHKHHEWWFRDSWYNAGVSEKLTISGAQTTPITRTYEWSVPHGEYQVRVTRLSPESKKSTLYNEIVWSTERTIINKPVFNTPVPICCSELRIRASEQLSGYVDNFNALCCSVFPVYQTSTKGWAKDADGDWISDETQNPADILRYLFLSRHALNAPYKQTKIDEVSLAAFWRWCNAQNYHFDFVCDSEFSAWNRWTAVASAGRGAVTTDNDGLFGVMIDNADKVVSQMFTPRNSWGFTLERQFYTMPHALRVSFYDETDNYAEKDGYVYADGYSKSNAADIVEWNFTGKTRWEDLYKMGRYYLASMRLRPVTITLSTDWEWMMCRRGDVVGVAHDVLMNTFGTARITALIYRNDDKTLAYVSNEEDKPQGKLPVGVRLDDSVHFSEEATYGIAIRQSSGKLFTYQVEHELGAATADILFSNTITTAQVPYIGALASVSTFGSEYAEYLLASISAGSDNSAELTLVPWSMPDILTAESKEIPEWEPAIKLDTIGHTLTLPPPTIKEIRSDESVLLRSGASLLSQIAVWWKLPKGIPAEFKRIYVQLRVKDAEGNTFNAQVDSSAASYVSVAGVEDGKSYTVYLRLASDTGVVSEWTTGISTRVVGKTSAPPDVMGLTAVPDNPEGIRLTWNAVTVADFDHYEVTGESSTKTIAESVVLPIYGKIGTLSFSVTAVDTLGIRSVRPAKATCTVLAPDAPKPTYKVLAMRGAEISWQNCKATWSIDHYNVQDVWAGKKADYADPAFSISPRQIEQDYVFHITAVDIFGNAGKTTTLTVFIDSIGVPVPSAAVDGTQLVISWKEVLSPFQVDVYEVADVNGKTLGKVKGTTFRFLAPAAGTYEYRVRAVDIIGQTSLWGDCSITLKPPKPPIVKAVLDGDHIELSWTQPADDPNTVPVIAYDIVRQWDVTRPDGLVDTNEEDYGRNDTMSLSVPAVSTGSHTFMVRAVDNAGNLSDWGTVDFTVKAPGRVTFFNCSAVDNNVMLYYTVPNFIFFPIREYLVEEMEDGIGAEIGLTDSQFFADIRTASGEYTYGITPVDIAGNLGERSVITVSVSQPPDFILYSDYHSLFNGEKTNMVLDGIGHMVGPVPVGETWQENAERVAGILDSEAENVSWQDKVDNGMEYAISPPVAAGVYTEVVDVGTLIPSTKISVIVTQDVLFGETAMTCKIEVSDNNEDWRTLTENGLAVYAASFRYVRCTFTWQGTGLVSISDIYFKLDVKRKMDFGQVTVAADDNGEGWVSMKETPMLTGKWVAFTIDFTDVQSFPQPQVVNDTDKTAHIVFEDKLNPEGFRIFVLDKTGNRVAATVDWAAYGV